MYVKNQWFPQDYQVIGNLVPDLSSAGRRSLISHLSKQQLIATRKVAHQTMMRLTSFGEAELEAVFPALMSREQTTNQSWSFIVFLTPPKTDHSFRYLRSFVIEKGAISVSRGCYLIPVALENQIKRTLELMYRDSVLMFRINEWVFGDQESFLVKKYHVDELINIYSGISNELAQLLDSKVGTSSLTAQQKMSVYSLYDRFYSVLTKDIGLTYDVFPQVDSPKDILSQLIMLLWF